MPWTGFIVPAVRRAMRPIERDADILRLCMTASVATAFVFYSLSASKLANYALVFFPPLAALVGLYLDGQLEAKGEPSATDRISSLILAGFGLALLTLPFAIGRIISPREVLGGVPAREVDVARSLWPAVLSAGLALCGGALALVRGSARTRITVLTLVGVVVPLSILAGASPVVRDIYPWEQFGHAIRSEAGPVLLYGYRAPSLTFYAGRPTHQIDDIRTLERVISGEGSAWLVIERTKYHEVERQLASGGHHLVVARSGGRMLLARVDVFND
jgi:hypothetical protein